MLAAGIAFRALHSLHDTCGMKNESASDAMFRNLSSVRSSFKCTIAPFHRNCLHEIHVKATM